MTLSGKFARHIETGAIVQIVEVGVRESTEAGLGLTPIVKFVSERGYDQILTVEDFFSDFEIVEELGSVVLTAPSSDDSFWAAVEELAAEFNVVVEYYDVHGRMIGKTLEFEESELDEPESFERVH